MSKMTSVSPQEENKAKKFKKKLLNDGQVKEETRAFLRFSRGNLSISHSDLEQGFNKPRSRFRKNTVISTITLIIVLLCVILEAWTLHCSLANAREVEKLKRDVENLKHRIREEDLLDELKAFEEQLYAEESNDDEDDSEADTDNTDYDWDDDDASSSHDYFGGYPTPAYGARPSDFPNYSSTLRPVPSPPDPLPNTDLLQKAQQENEKVTRGNKNKELVGTHDGKKSIPPIEDKMKEEKNTKHKRDTAGFRRKSEINNRKKSVRRETAQITLIDEDTAVASNERRSSHNQTRRMILKAPSCNDNRISGERNQTGSSDRHPPKKYCSQICLDCSSSHRDELTGQLVHSATNHSMDDVEDLSEDRGSETSKSPSQGVRRRMSKRHLPPPRQVYAVHYGADSNLLSREDEHTGNGRARHPDGIFKAWQPSDWVSKLGMNNHFSMESDGRLVVSEPGLYLAYAQIHYVDGHDENGFHLLVNGRSILQCKIYSPGVGHKSSTCFSAQVTMLRARDVLLLKEVGSARYTLLHQDKSFFGLVKLGGTRQQKHPGLHTTTQ